MNANGSEEAVALSSSWTVLLTRVFPWAFTLFGGGVAVAAWLGLLGPEAAEPLARWAILGAVVVGSGVQHAWLGRFRQVWLDGDLLVVGDPRRGIRIRLHDVTSVEETRLQKIKVVKVSLKHRTPVGDTIRFIPRGREGVLLPWLSSPVAAELRDHVRALQEGRRSPGALPPDA